MPSATTCVKSNCCQHQVRPTMISPENLPGSLEILFGSSSSKNWIRIPPWILLQKRQHKVLEIIKRTHTKHSPYFPSLEKCDSCSRLILGQFSKLCIRASGDTQLCVILSSKQNTLNVETGMDFCSYKKFKRFSTIGIANPFKIESAPFLGSGDLPKGSNV